MNYQTLLFLLCLLSSPHLAALNESPSDEEDGAPYELVVEDSEQALFQQAYFNAKHILQEAKVLALAEPFEHEALPPWWQNYHPQILSYKKLTELVNFFIDFRQTHHDFYASTSHSIDFCGEDLCSPAPCCACDYEYDPDQPPADGPCSKGFCNCMWIGSSSVVSGFLFMFRTLGSFLWCGPCGVYISLGLGTCAGAASTSCLACVPTWIKAVRKKLKERRLQTKLHDLTLAKEQTRLQFTTAGQCSSPDEVRLQADLAILQQDQVMNLILHFYKTQEIADIKTSVHTTEEDSLL